MTITSEIRSSDIPSVPDGGKTVLAPPTFGVYEHPTLGAVVRVERTGLTRSMRAMVNVAPIDLASNTVSMTTPTLFETTAPIGPLHAVAADSLGDHIGQLIVR